MTEACSPALIDLAHKLADTSGPLLRRHFRTNIGIDDKHDLSPVTAADREAEESMRTLIEMFHPEHGIIGEEFGAARADAEYVWVLDPIDGTKAFVTGKPLFGTLIGLLHRGEPILGVIDVPALNERWIGARGHRTTHNGHVVHTRSRPDLGQAYLYSTTPLMFKGPQEAAYARLRDRVKHALYGGDCYLYGLLSSGFIDLVCEASLMPYDYCALIPVVEGAGGVVTDWQGRRLTLESDGTLIAGGCAEVHAQALKALNG